MNLSDLDVSEIIGTPTDQHGVSIIDRSPDQEKVSDDCPPSKSNQKRAKRLVNWMRLKAKQGIETDGNTNIR